MRPPPSSPLFPYTPLFRSLQPGAQAGRAGAGVFSARGAAARRPGPARRRSMVVRAQYPGKFRRAEPMGGAARSRAAPGRRRGGLRGRLCPRAPEPGNPFDRTSGVDFQEPRARPGGGPGSRGVGTVCHGALRTMISHRIELDYVAPPRRAWWIGASVLILAVAVAGDLVLRYPDTQHELAALDAAPGRLNAHRRPHRRGTHVSAGYGPEINDAVVA